MSQAQGHRNYSDISSIVSKKQDSASTRNKVINLLLIVAVVVFAGSTTFAIQRVTTSTDTRASSDIPGNLAGSRTNLLIASNELYYTVDNRKVPKEFNGKAIPEKYLAQAKSVYKDISQDDIEAYVANRLILFYTLTKALDEAGVEYEKGITDEFWHIEERIPELQSVVKKNLLSTADYALIKATFNNSPIQNVINSAYENPEQTAKNKIEEYAEKLATEPQKFGIILNEANQDETLQLLNNREKNQIHYGYTDDDNDIPQQDTYIFDEEFDDLLFNQTPGQVSDVLLVNGQVPYVYFVIYPIKIEEKQYRSTTEIIQKYIGEFTF